MLGLMIRDLFSVRKKIYLMFAILGAGDLLLLIATLILKAKQKGADFFVPLRVERWFKGGVMAVSFAAMIVVFMMVSIIVTDKKSKWNKMLTTFPMAGTTKAAARYLMFFGVSFIAGMIQLCATFVMFKILKYDIQFGTIKLVYCPFAIGLLFVFVRMIFEYTFNTETALEYCAILAVFCIASSFIIYKFGGIDFPYAKTQVIKLYMKQIDRWLIPIIPCVMALGLLLASDKLVKPKTVGKVR